jgi:hypothetical protein
MKTFEVVYLLPSNLVTDNELGKSLHFHRFMRHARECHRNLLEFLVQEGLLSDVGGSTLFANERKTLLLCSDAVAARAGALPFVETAQEHKDVAAQIRQRQPAMGTV